MIRIITILFLLVNSYSCFSFKEMQNKEASALQAKINESIECSKECNNAIKECRNYITQLKNRLQKNIDILGYLIRDLAIYSVFYWYCKNDKKSIRIGNLLFKLSMVFHSFRLIYGD